MWVFVQSGCVLEILHTSVISLVCFVLLTFLLVRHLGRVGLQFKSVCLQFVHGSMWVCVCVCIIVCVGFA